jgi:hypothetical protein
MRELPKGQKGGKMLERLLIALGLKQKPQVRLSGIVRLQAALARGNRRPVGRFPAAMRGCKVGTTPSEQRQPT